ncbi:RNA polymerase subunit sigma-70 [Microvirga rosea]|uniref:RNA polymerase subunit sigma-70 n=1 Tax=Microvirga rosea TaxID=2715425 RepID=UPI001D0B5315|nr:RNA polymerase subunit sigma-70 [Microvirga rosea]MCB8821800.1 RNA polymerase subunit sigma-70 [Microvirga rosea]
MTTLKQFEEALREQGMHMALAILERLRQQDKEKRTIAPARRVSGRKMTPELAHKILELHATTDMTQQEIAFQLGVNQGRVNEVVKRRRWLQDDPEAPEAIARDKALARMERAKTERPITARVRPAARADTGQSRKSKRNPDQLSLEDLIGASTKP